MKYFTMTLALMLLSTSAFAGGKLQLNGNYRRDNKDFRPGVGLAVYQKIADGVAFNSWTGAGESSETGNNWAVGKYGFDFDIGRTFVAGGGLQFDYSFDKKHLQDSVFMKLEYKIW